jgi:NTE family protein
MKKSKEKKINLALQGGGAHGAFTWGVLDYLLEDGRLDFEAVTATSAGSMNAACLMYGLMQGGKDQARILLDQFWRKISEAGSVFSPIQRTPLEYMSALSPFGQNWSMEKSLAFNMFETVTRTLSPYQFNPYNINPLRTILEELIDFEALKQCQEGKLFISATNVRTGDGKIFSNKDMSIDVFLASSALPYLFHAVEIDGEYYWDGGFMGNPSLWPLFYKATTRDILIVHVNPIIRTDVPTQSYDIDNRINEITFNSSLMNELRSIAFVQKLLREDMLKNSYKEKYKDMLLHAIRAEETMRSLSVASKFDTSWPFLTHLKSMGREIAQEWISGHFDDIGTHSTIDIREDYLNPKLDKASITHPPKNKNQRKPA